MRAKTLTLYLVIQITSGAIVFGLLNSLLGEEAKIKVSSTAEFIHQTRQFESAQKPLPTKVKGYQLVKEILKDRQRLYRSDYWFVLDEWFDKPGQNYDCEKGYWVVRWKTQTNSVDIASTYAVIWAFRERNKWDGFDSEKDSIAIFAKIRIGRSGYISGSACESPVFKAIDYGNYMMDLILDIQIWEEIQPK